MPRYHCTAKFSPTGMARQRADGYAKREQSVRDLWTKLGCTVEAIQYSLGSNDHDTIVIVDGPRDAVFSVWTTVLAGGGVSGGEVYEFLTGEEADVANAIAVSYTSPS